MKHITAYHMLGFNAQLRKEAAAPGFIARMLASPGGKRRLLGEALQWTGKGLQTPGVGRKMVAGAGAGAGLGALTGEEGTRLERAIKGGLLGAGAVGGRFLTTKPGREWLGRFGQRQRYYLTGRGAPTKAQAREIGLLRARPEKEAIPKGLKGPQQEAFVARAEKKHAKELRRHGLEEEAFRKGYLSLPGMAHGLMSRQAGDVIRSGWQRQGPLGKAFLGLGGLETGRALASKPEPGGPGRVQKALRAAGQTAGWALAPHAMVPGVLAGAGLGAAGAKVGKGIDYGVGRLRRAPAPVYDY